MHKVPPKDEVPLKTELSLASSAYGEARQTLTKVFDRLRSGGGIEVPQLEGVVDSMVSSIFRNRDAMGWLARLKTKDGYLYSHSLSSSVWRWRSAAISASTRARSGQGTGAMLLDVGKMRLSDDLLRKSGKPTAAEWQEIREHVEYGWSCATSLLVDHRIVTMVEMHHERCDGSGYPRQPGRGDSIARRIAGIVDSYDAMISERTMPRRNPLTMRSANSKPSATVRSRPNWWNCSFRLLVFPHRHVDRTQYRRGRHCRRKTAFGLRPEVMLVLDAGKNVRDDS
jgi:HD-GYP domain-containing protein (c-di-GMP phosphodiesterase class II)